MIRTLLLTILSFSALQVFGQLDQVCEGDRLIAPIFSEVQITESVKFGVGTSVLNQEFDLLMDIYEPVGDDLKNRPVVVLAHGGSFVGGDRKNPVMVNTCTELAKRGYVAASIEYTLWPFLTLGFPDSTDLINVIALASGDLKTAIRFFNEDGLNENLYGVNPGLITAGGYSAGAILACHQGMLDVDDTLSEFVQTAFDGVGGIEGSGTNLDFSDEIISVFNISGSVYDVNFIDDNSSPIYSAHGDMDGTVPYMFGLTGSIMTSNGSFNINERYQSLGLESQLFTFEGGGHTDIFSDAIFADDLLTMYNDFFVWNKDQVCSIIASSDELKRTNASIFPNPTDGLLNFQLGQDLTSAYQIEVFNQLGQLFYTSQTIQDSKNQIDLSHLEDGLYVVKINFEENYQALTKRIVISNR